jgi:putative two-component system response regulator
VRLADWARIVGLSTCPAGISAGGVLPTNEMRTHRTVPQATLLVVDDEPLNVSLLSQLLRPEFRVLGALSGASALALMAAELPDLVLLDVMMPAMDGLSVLRQMRAQPALAAVPVIFVTALGAEFDEEKGLSLGAADYLVKPIKPAVLLARVRAHLALRQIQVRLADQNAWLERELARRIRDGLLAQDLMLCAMAELAETRDDDTGNHIQRTRRYVELLARQLQQGSPYAAALDEAQLQRIVKAAPMHDLGKIGIPDHILLKPGRLTPDEFAVMKTHARIGADTIAKAMDKVRAQHAGDTPPLAGDDTAEPLRALEVARAIAQSHHEHWDGHGYPDGLSGTAIPLPARLMAVADVFDALTSTRPYKASWPVADALAYIHERAGRQFDPVVVQALADCQAEVEAVAARLRG